ncbi:Probable zinc metalloprotease EGY1 [Durusdinium trenchii]|uniref:Chloroplastic (Protein AMMONIUM OVERLY SENSITIVE 1) (Protein ETHYLENE-DEPENDENT GRAVITROPISM-DEFICIENT AND YELLOW-GREEN 1) (AtEGY1) n=1 Tax=Durusdinium trenchii TaxID=1381693 RepID=A0ABP0M8C3_9DINO
MGSAPFGLSHKAVAQKRLMTRLARLLTRWDASHRRGVRIMAGLQKAAARESAQEKQKEAQAAQQALRQKRAAEAEARSLERAAAKRQREEHRNRWKWLNRKDITMEELLHSKGVRKVWVLAVEGGKGDEEDQSWRRFFFWLCEEARELWQKAYAIEIERSQRLEPSSASGAASSAPGSSASAAEWQAAYEVLKAKNLELEQEAVARRRRNLETEAAASSAAATETAVAPVPETAPKDFAEPRDLEADERPKAPWAVFGTDRIEIDSQQLADVARFRDALGPGTLPLLSALFEEDGRPARGELPPPGDVRDALELPGSGFTVTGSAPVTEMEWRDVGGRGTPRSFVEQRQASLDQRYGAGKYVVLLQRERPPPAPGLSLWPKGQFDPAKVDSAQKEGFQAQRFQAGGRPTFWAADLVMFLFPWKGPNWSPEMRLLIGASLAATASFCNIIAAAVGSLNGERSDLLLNKSVEEVTYSPMLGVAVTRLDADGVVPVGVGLFLMLFAQGFARKQVAELNDAKIRGGYFIPSSSLGTLGRTWGFAGSEAETEKEVTSLAPSRRTEIDVTLAGSYAGLCGALALCLLGVLRGDASDGLLLVEVTRLPLLLAQALGDSFPDDAVRTVLSLSSGEAAASAPAKVTVDPLLLSGSLALTSQAVQLLPLRGCDGHLLARFLFGPRPLQFIELCTGVLLLLGAVGRLGPNANATVCSSALFGWAARFLASRESPLPPREDFDDEPWASPTAAAAAALALAAAGLQESFHSHDAWCPAYLVDCRIASFSSNARSTSQVHGKAFFPLGAGGVSFFLSKGHLLLDEEEDEEEEEDFSAHSWNKCQPEPFASGAQVFAAEAARAPETGIHAPTEAAWFRQYAEQNNCKWQQLSFGPSFGASRTDTGEIFLWGSTLRKDGKNRQYAPPRPLFLKDETELRFRDVQCSESSVWGLTAAGDVVVWQRVPRIGDDPKTSPPGEESLPTPSNPSVVQLRALLEARAEKECVTYDEATELMLRSTQCESTVPGFLAVGGHKLSGHESGL